MSIRLSLIASAVALCLGLLVQPASTRAADVDLALVVAVDISNSMDTEEQELQRNGFVEAFRSSLVHDAIRSGILGRISVTYVEWAGSTNQRVVVPWTDMEGAEDAVSFADELAKAPIRRGPRTSISGALDFSMGLLAERSGEAMRQVIDVSGDGANNHGRPMAEARQETLAKGVVINGLPLLLKRGYGAWDVARLDEYYRGCVIGGPGSFMIPVRERNQFADAIKTKIIREIAMRDAPPVVIPAQAEATRDCTAAENPSWRN